MSFASASSLVAGASIPTERTRQAPGRFECEHILVPLLTAAERALTDQLRVAASLARTSDGSLHVVNPVTESRKPVKVYRDGLTDDDERELLDWAVPEGSSSASQMHGGFLSSHRLISDIVHTVETSDIDTLVVPSEADTGRIRPGLADRLALRVECNVITVNGRRGYEHVPSILLAVAGGPHSGLATDLARQIAADCDAWIDVLHVVDEDAPDHRRRQAETYVEGAFHRIDRYETTTTWILEADDVASAIIEQSSYYGLTIVGAPTKGRLRRFISGSTNRSIRNNARSVVLSARKNR